MFIKDSVFKKLVKSAWKRNDLVIAHEGGYYRIDKAVLSISGDLSFNPSALAVD